MKKRWWRQGQNYVYELINKTTIKDRVTFFNKETEVTVQDKFKNTIWTIKQIEKQEHN